MVARRGSNAIGELCFRRSFNSGERRQDRSSVNEHWIAAFQRFVRAAAIAIETGDLTSGYETRDTRDSAAELPLRGLNHPLMPSNRRRLCTSDL